jgi:antitoxin ParD1/3/4
LSKPKIVAARPILLPGLGHRKGWNSGLIAGIMHQLKRYETMQPAEKLSITLPADVAQMLREKVEGGDYASNSEVIREALRCWQEREALRTERLNIIRNKIAESIDDPRPAIPAIDVRRRLKALHQKTIESGQGV